MKKRDYLSPSSLKKYKDSPDDFYLQYLSENRPPRGPQTQPMSVGSAFDAAAKSYMYHAINGGWGPNDLYHPRVIFEAQVEAPVRDWAWPAGQYVFEKYKNCGALADLMMEIGKAATDPQFEVEVRGTIEGKRTAASAATGDRREVVLYGKPDVSFVNAQGTLVIFDWKVNGFCSKSSVSPKPGYRMVRDAWSLTEGTMSRGSGMAHRDYVPMQFKGMEVNGSGYLENYDAEWAIQLATYAWLYGEKVGVESVAAIDQIVAKPNPTKPERPWLRVASHRGRISSGFQHKIIEEYIDLWDRINSGHFYRELSREESDARCVALDKQSYDLYFNPDRSAEDVVFAELVRPAPKTYTGSTVSK